MLLYIFKNGDIKTVRDNPTVVDMVAVSSGILTILKFNGKEFVELVIKDGKSHWTKTEEADMISCSEGRFHQ